MPSFQSPRVYCFSMYILRARRKKKKDANMYLRRGFHALFDVYYQLISVLNSNKVVVFFCNLKFLFKINEI
jgi:hypothetical protein